MKKKLTEDLLKKMIKEEKAKLLKESNIHKLAPKKENGDEILVSVYPNEGFMLSQKLGGKVDRVYLDFSQLEQLLKLR